MPHWALAPTYFAFPCVPFLAYGSPLAAGLGPCSPWGGEPGPCFRLIPSSSPVPYDICRPDHSVLTLHLPVTASVREVMAALAHEDHWTKGQALVKVNSAGGELCLWINSLLWEVQIYTLEFRPLFSRPAFEASLPHLLWLFQTLAMLRTQPVGSLPGCGSQDGMCELFV